jgi:hypothetical protein
LPIYAGLYWQAFLVLRGERPAISALRVAAGPGGSPFFYSETEERPIPFSAIERYARAVGISGATFSRLVRFVTALDDEERAVLRDLRAGMVAGGDDDNEAGRNGP